MENIIQNYAHKLARDKGAVVPSWSTEFSFYMHSAREAVLAMNNLELIELIEEYGSIKE